MNIQRLTCLVFYLFLAFVLMTCTEPFSPPRTGYDDLLVVDGFVSNDTSSYTVKLTHTYPIDTTMFSPESGAQVSIVDDMGSSNQLHEKSPGVYKTDSTTFIGEIGRGYQLKVHTQGGKDYLSDVVAMRQTPPIDSVYYDYVVKAANNDSGKQPGLQIYVDSHDPENNTSYYRWEYEDTWQIVSPLPSYFEFDGDSIVSRKDNVTNCWNSSASTQILIATSKNLSVDRISSFPLAFVPGESKKLRTKYSILVRQYALGADAYLFWENIKQTSESLGSLFDPQPGTVKGNIHNVTDPNEPVLGYFDAASVAKMRIFISRRDLKDYDLPPYFSYCENQQVPNDSIDFYHNYYRYNLVAPWYGERGLVGYYMTTESCSDCRLQGSNVRPDFWK